MIKKINLKEFTINDIAMIIFFSNRLITKLFSSFFGVKGVILTMAVLAIFYIIGIFINIKKKDYLFTFFIFAFFLIAFMTTYAYYFNPAIGYWILDSDFGFIVKVLDVRSSISALLVILLVNKSEKLFRNFKIIGYILFSYSILHILLFLLNGNWEAYFITYTTRDASSSYNMNLGYDILFSGLILASIYLKEKRLHQLIIASIAVGLSVIYGSRGAIVIYAAYLVLAFLLFIKDLGLKEIIKFNVLFLVFTVIVSFAYIKIDNFILENTYLGEKREETMLEGEESPSRSIEMISEGEFTNSNGRLNIWDMGLEAFSDKPIFGYGVFGDRPYVGKYVKWGYSHNIFVEILANFGLVGFTIFIAFLVMVFITIFKLAFIDRVLVIILASMSIKLILSDSFWYLPHFWGFLGLMIIFWTRNKKVRAKLLSLASIIFAVLSIIFVVLFLKRDIENQAFKIKEFDKPTVILSFSNLDKNIYYLDKKYLAEKGIKHSVFIDTKRVLEDKNYININELKILDRQGIEFNEHHSSSKSYKISTYEKIRSDLDSTNDLFSDYLSYKPLSVIAPYYGYDSSVKYALKEDRKFILDVENRDIYSEIKETDRISLKTQRINNINNMKTFNERMEYLEGLTDEAVEKNGLIVITLRANNPLDYIFLRNVADMLEDKNFEFIDFQDLNEMTDLKAGDDVNLIDNYLKNSSISSIIDR